MCTASAIGSVVDKGLSLQFSTRNQTEACSEFTQIVVRCHIGKVEVASIVDMT